MRHALALALLLLAAPAGAATIVIDFTVPGPGYYENSITPADGVVLSEWLGGELAISTRTGAPVLFVGAQGGTLLLDFAVPVVFLEILFGGDSPSDSVEAKPAVLVGIAGGTFAGISSVVANRNGLIDQTLRLATPNSPPIEQALFSFVQLGEHQPLSPAVGRITLVTVPEPGAGLLLSALALLGSLWGLARRGAAHRR